MTVFSTTGVTAAKAFFPVVAVEGAANGLPEAGGIAAGGMALVEESALVEVAVVSFTVAVLI